MKIYTNLRSTNIDVKFHNGKCSIKQIFIETEDNIEC